MMFITRSSTRGLNGITLFVVGIFIFSLLTPAAAAPVLLPETADDNAGLAAMLPLTGADVASPDINLMFDIDGVIMVNDLENHFLPDGTSGDALLQTRLYPKGETGTIGAGLFAYLYRVDLSGLASSALPSVCVDQIDLPFGAIVPRDYDLDDSPEDYFVISMGGAAGSLAPSIITQDSESGSLTIQFATPICSGGEENIGESSFFVGFAAATPYMDASAQVSLTSAEGDLTLDTRFPAADAAVDCFQLSDPAEIPSPAVINFDSLADGTKIDTSYAASYGVTFTGEVYAQSAPSPLSARSAPNVAYAPTFVSNPTIQFSFASPISHIGFYAGNSSPLPVDADITLKDGTGGVLCTIPITLPAETLNTFIGLYQPASMISQMEIGYDSYTPEIIDDLIFAPGSAGVRTEFPRALMPLSAGGPKITVLQSDNTRFAATFDLPDPHLWMAEQAGIDKPRLRFGLPGSEINSNREGYPDVPVIRRLIAIPEGSTPSIDLAKISVLAGDQFLTDLYPSQPSAVDVADEFVDPPFTLDPVAYATPANFPVQPAYVYPVGKMRDLNLALLVVAGGQYNPVSRRLVLFKEVSVEVSFQGGVGKFLPDYSDNLFEPRIDKLYGQVLNSSVIGNYVTPVPVDPYIGYEFLIFTHHNFLEAADRLAEWKNSKGISTKVIDTSDPSVDSAGEIKSFIKDLYDNAAVRPAYVLLFGDSEYVGSFFHENMTQSFSSYSDLDYSLMTEGDNFPDLAYGRIPVDTLQQANIVVDKIIAYEQDPPTLSSFYDTVTLAAFFECCSGYDSAGNVNDARSFIESSETARVALIVDGKTVNRIYTTDVLSDHTPAFYYNGADLPSDIGADSEFAWSGSTADVIEAFNNGTGLIMHRDHGNWQGWGNPDFFITDIPSLENGSLTPVVYSINCSSGVWDNELWETPPMNPPMEKTDTSWIEMMLRQEDGAVSLIGDTRNSPTWANSALARGLFDATWPFTDLTYGGNTIHYRLGDILNYAKLYLYTQVSIPQTGEEVLDIQYEYDNIIFHVIGDPTLELWRTMPVRHLTHDAVYNWGGLTAASNTSLQAVPTLTIDYPIDGVVITILQNGQPVGRGMVESGQAVIKFVADFDPNAPLQVSACQDDDICVELDPPTSFVFLPLIKR